MNAIGFRASPSELWYAIISVIGDEPEVQSIEKIKVPQSLNFPEQLNYIRKTVKDILEEYGIGRAGIRTTESNAERQPSIERISFEAILLELLSSTAIEKYLQGQISTMSPKLGIARNEFRPLIDNKKSNYRSLDLTPYTKLQREAILVAIASVNM